MQNIPITQMEIIRDNSALFYKDLPLNPYYKAMTNDILQSQQKNLLKSVQIQDIEGFFKEYICEKDEEEDEEEEQSENDNDREYNDNSEILPSSEYTSQYGISSQHLQYNSSTSLQELIENRLKNRKPSNFLEESKKPTEIKPKIKKEVFLSVQEKKPQKETDYYSFPNKYKNYKYAKYDVLLSNNTEKKRSSFIKTQKKNKSHFTNEKTNISISITEKNPTLTQNKDLIMKAFVTQQKGFLSLEDRKKNINFNLEMLHYSPQKNGYWESPFVNKTRLPRIIEMKEKTLKENKLNYPRFLKINLEKQPREIDLNEKNIQIKGKTLMLPKVNQINLNKIHFSPAEYKQIYSEFQMLKKISKNDFKKLKIQQKNSDSNERSSQFYNETIKIESFLEFYKDTLQNKPWNLVSRILKCFNFTIKNQNLIVTFKDFMNFNRILVKKKCSFEEEVTFISDFFFLEAEKSATIEIKNTLDILFFYHEHNIYSSRQKNPEKERIYHIFGLEIKSNPSLYLEKKNFLQKLKGSPELVKSLMQVFRLKT